MNITVDRVELSRAARVCTAATGKSTQHPILKSVILRAADGEVWLSATDTEIGYARRTGAVVQADGHVAVNAADFAKSLERLSGELVDLSVAASRLVMTSGSTTLRLPMGDVREYPTVPAFESATSATVRADHLLDVIRQVTFVASLVKSDARYGLNGVDVECFDDTMRLAACDGRCLAYADCPVSGHLNTDKMLIPAQGLAFIAKVVAQVDGKITIEASDGYALRVSWAEGHADIRMISGEFPDYRALISTAPFKHEWTVDRSELQRAMRTASIFNVGVQTRTALSVGEDSVAIDTADANKGAHSDSVSAVVHGEDLKVGVSPTLLAGLLAAADCDDVTFRTDHEMNALQIYPENNPSSFFLLMPTRLH